MKNSIIIILISFATCAFGASASKINTHPSTLQEALRVVTRLSTTLDAAGTENEALKGILAQSVVDKNELTDTVIALKGNIGKLTEYAKAESTAHWAEYDRAESEKADRIESDRKYHKLKWPLVGLAGFFVVVLGFYFLGPISRLLGPWGIYAPVAPLVAGIITAIITTFLI